MAKSRDGEDPGKKTAATPKKAATPPPADSPARSAGPTRRQVRQIARLVGRLEALGELEARRRRQLQVALEKGRKTKRQRQQVDRAATRVGELIERLRTLARELESPVPSSASVASTTPGVAAKPAPQKKSAAAAVKTALKTAPKTRTAAAAGPTARTAKPTAAGIAVKPAAATRSKPANP